MAFWNKKKKIEDKALETVSEPVLEPALEDSAPQELVAQDDTQKPVEPAEELSKPEEQGGWLSRLGSGLSKSSNKISQGLSGLVTKKRLDAAALESLEELLIEADLGPMTAAKIMGRFAKERLDKDISEDDIRKALADEMAKILEPVAKPLVIEQPEDGPYVILFSGVNGVGKTTTIGKLASHLVENEGKSVMMAAGDTFRAAAVEQLEEWSRRVGCPFLSKSVGADSAAVAYEAYAQAKAQGVDVLLIDTAGRLQNKSALMEELKKIVRVLKKQNEAIPHASLLVLDATTGQNAFSQVEIYKDMIDITGLIVTKLDGSAKGGVLVGLADRFGVPVHAIGVGEGIEDMQPFKSAEYARSLMGLSCADSD